MRITRVRYTTTASSKLNSLGKPIHSTDQGIKNFWRWFGKSVLTDGKGRPLVLYHGTDADFHEFIATKVGQKDSGFFGSGYYLTADQELADAYGQYNTEIGWNTMIVYAKLLKPYIWNVNHSALDKTESESESFTAKLRSEGYDGVIFHMPYKAQSEGGWGRAIAYMEVVVFEPNQIKSAIGNCGAFNVNNNKLTANDNKDYL